MTILETFALDGRRALVTGAGRGIGQAISLGIAAAGASVALTSRSADQLAETERLIVEAGGTAAAVPADLSDSAGLVGVVDAVEAALGGPLDIVVHCAGAQHREAAVTFPFEAWEHVLRVNLTAPFLLSQEIGRRQLAAGRPGSHVFVTSLTSILGLPDLVAYNAAKSGLMGVVRALSREWSRKGVRINAVSPGYIDTAMTHELFQNPDKRQKLLDRIPMEHFGDPADLAAPTVFLASEASSYITGQMLIVDGGWAAA